MDNYIHQITSLVVPTFKVEDSSDQMSGGDVGIMTVTEEEPCRVVARIAYAKHNLGQFPKGFTDAVYKQPLWVKDNDLQRALERVYSKTKYYVLPSTFNLDIDSLSNEQLYYLLVFLSRRGRFVDDVTTKKLP